MASLPSSILLVILPCANFDSVYTMDNEAHQIHHHINPVENKRMEFIEM